MGVLNMRQLQILCAFLLCNIIQNMFAVEHTHNVSKCLAKAVIKHNLALLGNDVQEFSDNFLENNDGTQDADRIQELSDEYHQNEQDQRDLHEDLAIEKLSLKNSDTAATTETETQYKKAQLEVRKLHKDPQINEDRK